MDEDSEKIKYGQGGKIFLFADNAPSYLQLNLKNVKIVFLPSGKASIAQPMDQAIIQAVKLNPCHAEPGYTLPLQTV